MSLLDLGDRLGPSGSLIGAGLVLLLAYFIINPVSLDREEPPLVRPKVPFIGHIIGIFQHSWYYLTMVYHRSNKLSIFTLPMLNGKMYVIADPELTQSFLRNRHLSFDPHLRDTILGLACIRPETLVIWDNPDFYIPWVKIIYDHMGGKSLLQLNTSVLRHMAASLNGLDAAGLQVEDLYKWNRDILTLASTDSLYGEKNPFRRNKELIEAYWTYEREIPKMMPNILPSLIAPKGYRARSDLIQAFTNYFNAGYDASPEVPPLVKDRCAYASKFQMPPSEIAAIELIFAHGALSNTFPTYYWLFTRVFNQPSLVERLREEVSSVIEETGTTSDGQRKVTLHAEKLEEKLPLLMSCYRETHRLSADGIIARKVMADTTISDGQKRSYVLKKGSHAQALQGGMQKDKDIWGENVKDFVGDRFLKLAEEKGEMVSSYTARGFFGFGGGKHICPGRFFAGGEILGSMILLLSSFDVTTPEGGAIPVPGATKIPVTGSMGKPVPGSDLRGRITRRPGWENVQWEIAP
ncbi:prostacyclin synthase [Colletotrichum truncatum]|uniref:Prostacyclin synthase n=1 Tax=Colletotrichum truncatum TaxID=5467 RepID=A0ACC3YVK1_COLTU|nr:prostacyclin synthase [Colletotrichum truncatum]KAF6791311.1 prostacyclin synthase [Colletotrichum truncatum]